MESARTQEMSAELGHWVGKHRIIDRRGNIYYERVVDQETGEELRHIEEPLSEHTDRGSARPRPGGPFEEDAG